MKKNISLYELAEELQDRTNLLEKYPEHKNSLQKEIDNIKNLIVECVSDSTNEILLKRMGTFRKKRNVDNKNLALSILDITLNCLREDNLSCELIPEIEKTIKDLNDNAVYEYCKKELFEKIKIHCIPLCSPDDINDYESICYLIDSFNESVDKYS